VVDYDWASTTWSSNIPVDYAFLVVDDVGKHQDGYSTSPVSSALDIAVPAMGVSFTAPTLVSDLAYALGYSKKQDPDFRYCVQTLEVSGYDGYVLDGCGLSGGSSGGP
jgi:hypothetical protein